MGWVKGWVKGWVRWGKDRINSRDMYEDRLKGDVKVGKDGC